MTDAYRELEDRFRRLGNLSGAASVLHWDWSTMMPAGSAAVRAAQLAELDLLCHELMTNPRVEALLETADATRDALDDWQRANLAEMRHHWRHATALPAELVEALSTTAARCEMVWRDARPTNDFAAFAAAFEPLLALVREKAVVLGEVLGCAPYDGLIDSYDPGLSRADVDPLFDDLAAFLPGFLDEIRAKQARDTAPSDVPRRLPVDAQQTLAESLMTRIGFDFERGRLDTSLHPFCGGAKGDIRITTRYDADDVLSGLMGILHETGHALYEIGLPEAWRLQPVGKARGMALHESQSLLIEMQACRSREFYGFLWPLLRDAGADLGSGTDDALHAAAVRVAPGPIRVDADEVTYPAHILLRYGLETAMIAGDLAVADIPGAWRDGMVRLLGVTPRDHAEGCLQDIHWSVGEIGYFPSYTLGALMAAQFFDTARRADPSLMGAIGRGDFAPLRAWLGENVHGLASRYSTTEIVERATGRPLGTEIFKAHLRKRYLG